MKHDPCAGFLPAGRSGPHGPDVRSVRRSLAVPRLRRCFTVRPAPSRLVLSLTLLLAACSGSGVAPKPSVTPGAVVRSTGETVDARSILDRMARRLAGSPAFSVTLRDGYDVVQASGEKIEFNEIRDMTVSRPNGLRIEVEESNGRRHLLLYDGATLTAYSPADHVYAQTVLPGGLDRAVTHVVQDLGMRVPLAVLLLSRFPEEIASHTRELSYVEWSMLDGVPTHHLAGRTDAVDYQVWIAAGAEPVPVRVVLTYRDAEGQPAFRARFTDWDFSIDTGREQFVFQPPAEARRIGFAAELARVSPVAATERTTTGGQP